MILINVISDQFGTLNIKHSLVSQYIPVVNLGVMTPTEVVNDRFGGHQK